MSRQSGNGEPPGEPTRGKLQRILGRAKSEKTEQAAAKRTRDARERARQARVQAQRDRKKGTGK